MRSFGIYRVIICKYLYNAGKYNFTFVNYPDRNNAQEKRIFVNFHTYNDYCSNSLGFQRLAL